MTNHSLQTPAPMPALVFAHPIKAGPPRRRNAGNQGKLGRVSCEGTGHASSPTPRLKVTST